MPPLRHKKPIYAFNFFAYFLSCSQGVSLWTLIIFTHTLYGIIAFRQIQSSGRFRIRIIRVSDFARAHIRPFAFSTPEHKIQIIQPSSPFH